MLKDEVYQNSHGRNCLERSKISWNPYERKRSNNQWALVFSHISKLILGPMLAKILLVLVEIYMPVKHVENF